MGPGMLAREIMPCRRRWRHLSGCDTGVLSHLFARSCSLPQAGWMRGNATPAFLLPPTSSEGGW